VVATFKLVVMTSVMLDLEY